MTATSRVPPGRLASAMLMRSATTASTFSSQVIDALAVARLTRLVVKDKITEPLRDAVLDMLEPDPAHPSRLAYLLQCPWCASPYIAAGVVLARRVMPRAWAPVASVLAFSELTGFLVTHE